MFEALAEKTAKELFEKESDGFTFIENFINDEFLRQFDVDENFRLPLNQQDIIYYLNKFGTINNSTPYANKIINFLNFLINTTNIVVQKIGVTYDIDDYILNGIPEEIEKSSNSLNYDDIFNSNDKVVGLYKDLTRHMFEKGNHLGTLVTSGASGNHYSLGSSFLSYGYRIDSENLVSKKFTKEALFDGLADDEDFYNAALSSRNALLQTVDAIPASGYIYRKLSHLLPDVKVWEGSHYCGNTRTLPVFINNDNFHKYKGRNFISNGEIDTISDYNKESVINNKVGILSPIFCKAPDKKLCKTCLGIHSNGLTGFGPIGIFTAMMFSSDITQALLSTKHLQFVVVKHVPENLKKYISYEYEKEGFVILQDLTSEQVSEIVDNYTPPFKEYTLTKNRKKGEVLFEVKNTKDNTLVNTSLNSLLGNLKHLIEATGEEYKGISDPVHYYSKYIEFGDKVDFKINPVHYEIILSVTWRDNDDPTKLKRYDEEDTENGTVLGIPGALMNRDSILDLLLFERIRNTISDYKLIAVENEKRKHSELESFLLGEI